LKVEEMIELLKPMESLKAIDLKSILFSAKENIYQLLENINHYLENIEVAFSRYNSAIIN
jgi:hypothetical protein